MTDAPTRPIKSGVFIAPFHPADEDPTEQIHRDLGMIQFLETLGYDEAWIGEHHSGGYEIIPSPEVFIAHAAAIRELDPTDARAAQSFGIAVQMLMMTGFDLE